MEVKVMSQKKVRKNVYWAKLNQLLDEYKNILIITVDFVGSKQMQNVRQSIRGEGHVLMGKNTIIRRVLRERSETNPKLKALLPFIKGNMGFIFTDKDLNQIRKKVMSFKLPAAAKAGILSPCDVVVPAGPTGLDPGQTSFFQTLNVSTRITKGTIEITAPVHLCWKGEKVSASAVALLSKLNMRPFEFGIEVPTVYEDGSVYDASVLDLSQADLIQKFGNCAAMLAAVSYEIGEVNRATIPHSVGKAFNAILFIAMAADYSFEQLDEIKANMSSGPATGGASGDAAAPAAVEEEEEEEEQAAPDMFGDDGDAADY